MFRSSIKKRNHIWACLNGCIFSCPDSPWHYCWSPLPLRLCRRHLETADKKDPCSSAAWEQWPQAGRLESLCCGETTVTRLLLRGTPAQREATYGEPVCFESCPCAFHGGEVWAIKHRSGLVLTWEDDEPGNRQKITDCRNNFPGSVCRDFIFLFGKCWVSANHWVQWKKQLCEQHSWNEEKLILT